MAKRLNQILKEKNLALEGFKAYLEKNNINLELNPNSRVDDEILSYLEKYNEYTPTFKEEEPITIEKEKKPSITAITSNFWEKKRNKSLKDILGEEYLRIPFNVYQRNYFTESEINIDFKNAMYFFKLFDRMNLENNEYKIDGIPLRKTNSGFDFSHLREIMMLKVPTKSLKDAMEDFNLSLFEMAMIFKYNYATKIKNDLDHRIFITEYNYLKYYKNEFLKEENPNNYSFEIYQTNNHNEISKGFSYQMEIPKESNESDEDFFLRLLEKLATILLKYEIDLNKSQLTHFVFKSNGPDGGFYKNFVLKNFVDSIQEKDYEEILNYLKQNFIEKFKPDEIPEEFNLKHNFEQEFNLLIQNFNENDLVINQAERSFEFEDKVISTRFTDFQIFSICAGVEQAYLRNIAKKYFNNSKLSNQEKYEAYLAVNNLVKEQGMEMVKFILTLPSLPFGKMDAKRIFSEFEKRRFLNDYPTLRLNIGDENKVIVSFYTKKGKINNSVLEVKDSETKKVILSLDRNGKIIPNEEVKNIIPTLLLFKNFVENEDSARELILNYGVKTGECSICGRPLNDPESLKRGIGPVCASYIY